MNSWNRITFTPIKKVTTTPEKNEIRFLLVSGNKVRVVYDNRYILLSSGDFLIVNAQKNLIVKNSNDCFYISVFIRGDEFRDMATSTNISHRIEGCSAIETTKADRELKHALMQLVNLRMASRDSLTVDILKVYYEIITLIMKAYVVTEANQSDLTANLNSKTKRAYQLKDYIDLNYRKGISLKELAGYFYLSTAYTSHLFKEIFQISFHQYVTGLKLESACDDVVNTDDTMTNIALQNGFPNVGSFNIAFKQKYQQTPTKYREIIRSEKKSEGTSAEITVLQPQMNALVNTPEGSAKNNQLNLNWSELMKKESSARNFNRNWLQVINLGSAESLLLGSYERQIKKVQSEIHFNYGRLWGLFTDDMLMTGISNSEIYSFTQIDNVLDLLLRNSLRPFIELGPKPLVVNINTDERLKNQSHYHFISNPSFDRLKFLDNFIRHCIGKWGKDEVSTWQFEDWCPSRTVMNGELSPSEDRQDITRYLKRFDKLKGCIKALLPDAKVGGCGLSVDYDYDSVDVILREWRKHQLPDFFSIYLYAQNFEFDQSDLNVQNQLSNDPDKMGKMVKNVQTKLRENKLTSVPLYVTEWNVSISDRNYIHDSLFQSAYILRNILHCFDKVDVFAYWQLSDIPGAFGDTRGILHGGAGLLTKDNLAKTSYYIFQLLTHVTGKVLYQTDNLFITSRGQEKLNVIVTNYAHFNGVYYLNKENKVHPEQLNTIFESNASLQGKLQLTNLTSGTYILKTWQLDEQNTDIFTSWLRWGRPVSLSNEDIEYLRYKIRPDLMLNRIVVKDGHLNLNYQLNSNDTVFFEVYKEF